MNKNDLLPYLQDLVVFTTVADCGSFSKAAITLGLNPSNVSRAVSRLEKKLQIQLLHRTTRQLNMTEQGRNVYEHSLQMLHAAEQAIHVAYDMNEQLTGKIRIYSPRALGKLVLNPIILKFLHLHPQLDIVLQLDDRPIDLIAEHVDLEFRVTEQPPLELMGREVMFVEQILCASTQYLSEFAAPTHPEQLQQHRCICLSPDMIDTRWHLQCNDRSVNIDIQPHYCVNNAEARLDAIKHHIGIGTMPKFIADPMIEKGLIQQVLTSWNLKTNYTGTIWMLYAPSKHIPQRIKALRDFFLLHLGQ